MLVSELFEFFLPIPVYLVAILAVLCVRAFRRPSSRLWRARWVLVGATLWCWIFSTPAIANAWLRDLEDRYPDANPQAQDPNALIFVLGSGSVNKRNGRWEIELDTPGWERTIAAIRLWRKTGGEILFAGGSTPDGSASGGQVMADVALAAGVPREAIRVETKSASTYENVLFSRDLLAQRGDEHVWLVTSAMHMPRAMAVAAKLGLHPHPAPCDRQGFDIQHWYAWLPHSTGPAMFGPVLHERIGLLVYRLRGRAL